MAREFFIPDFGRPEIPQHGLYILAGIDRLFEAMDARDAAKAKREQGPQGLLDWARRYLPDHFKAAPSAMHQWIADQLEQMTTERGVKLNVLGPRCSAKSTVVTLAYVLRTALEGREPYIWILSDTKAQAYAHLENLKAELVDNELLAAAYPKVAGRGPVWRAGTIVLRNGVTIDALSTGQRIRGRRRREHRPTLIVCDDLQNDSHIDSAPMREHSRSWFHGTLMKAGTPKTNFVNLATALHRDALALELHRTPGWTSRVFQAICEWPENGSLWEAWESVYANPENPQAKADARRFYEEHRAAMDAGAVVLWPEFEDLYTLMALRLEDGRTSFEREKQSSPIDPAACEWPEAYFDERLWFDQWPEHLEAKVLALDPSKGADARRGDYSAFVRLGLDRQGILYVEADLARRSTPQIIADGVEHYRQFQPDAFGVETNQYQDLLGSAFAEEFQRQGLLGVAPCGLDNQVNKRVRIRRLGPYLAARRLRMKSDSPPTRLLVNQLREFPVSDHDDGPDALEMAIRLLEHLLARPPDDGLGDRLPVG